MTTIIDAASPQSSVLFLIPAPQAQPATGIGARSFAVLIGFDVGMSVAVHRPSLCFFLPCPDNDPASRTPREEAPMQFPTGSVVALSSAAATMFSMGMLFLGYWAGTSRCRGGSATTS